MLIVIMFTNCFVLKTEGRQLLECISNWDEDGMKPELLQIILSKTESAPNGYLKWVKVIRSAGMVLSADHRSVVFNLSELC